MSHNKGQDDYFSEGDYDDVYDREFYRNQKLRRFSSNNSKNYSESRTRYNKGKDITIEERYLGKLIGRGGSQIRDLEKETNTKIIVNNE